MRRLADKRYSNLWDGVISKCMVECSGRCVKELEILRPFQTWSCLYKAWSCRRSRRREEEPEEIRVREHRSVSEEETCAVYEPVPSTVTVPSASPSLNILKL